MTPRSSPALAQSARHRARTASHTASRRWYVGMTTDSDGCPGCAGFASTGPGPRLFDGRVFCMEIVPAKVRVPAAQSINDGVVIQIETLLSIEQHQNPFAPDQAPEGRKRLVDREPRTRRFLAEQSAVPVQ